MLEKVLSRRYDGFVLFGKGVPLIGLFLGAGASFEAGLPLVSDLTAEFRRTVNEEKIRIFNLRARNQGAGFPDEVINDVVVALNNPIMHYENILGYVETRIERAGLYQQDYARLYSWMVDLVWYILYRRHVDGSEYIRAGLRYIDGIIGIASETRPLWIFSLNHDLVVECLAARYKIPVSAGFDKEMSLPLRDSTGQVFGALQVDTITKDQLESGNLKFLPHGRQGINLLKIHGALDMFTFNDGADVLSIMSRPVGDIDVLNRLTLLHENVRFIEPQTGRPTSFRLKNEILYTDINGGGKILRRSLLAGAFKFDARRPQTLPKIYLPLFERHLNDVTELVSIGYGFGDTHINLVIRQWLERVAARRLVIVRSGTSSVPEEFRHVFNQVFLERQSAVGYLEKFSHSPLSPDEIVLRDIRSKTREEKRAADGFA